jgi:hypothetical protein
MTFRETMFTAIARPFGSGVLFFTVYPRASEEERPMLNRFSNAPASPSTRWRRTLALGIMGAAGLLWGRQASAQVNVTQYHYDSSGTGQNLGETTLTPDNVNPTQFGKLFTDAVDGFVYTQPLYLSGVMTASGPHNVVYVGTTHDSVYAFDADDGGLLWQRSFINSAAGIIPVPTPDLYPTGGVGFVTGIPDIRPEIGITGTPVIDYNPDTGAGTLFVVTKTRETRGTVFHYVQKLYALDVGTGADRIPGGKLIGDSSYNISDGSFVSHDPANPCVPGTGDGSINGMSCFHGRRNNQRMGLALFNGVVWITFSSHGDQGPYHGWVLGYDEATLNLVAKLNTTPNGGLAGIWEGGGAPVFDAAGNMYLVTGNGTFRTDPGPNPPAAVNYGETNIKLSTTPDSNGVLPVLDFFVSFEQQALNNGDVDQGSGGITILPAGYVVQTGKRGKIYVMDPTNLGGYRHGTGCDQEPVLETCDNTLEHSPNGTVRGGSYSTPAVFFNGSNTHLYYGGNGDNIKQFRLDPDTGLISDFTPFTQSDHAFGFTGVTPTISANGSDSGILWGLDVSGFGPPQRQQPSPTILFAYDASDLSHLLYSSDTSSQRDQMGDGVKFNTPTVANGRVYVGTQGTCQETDKTANCGTLEVFGLFPDVTSAPSAPSGLSAMTGPPFPAAPSITLTWTNNADNATGVIIERSINGTTFAPVAQVGRNRNTFTDTNVLPATTYFYRVRATNQLGDSTTTNVASATTHVAGSVVTTFDIFDSAVNLHFTQSSPAGGHYDVQRSTDGTSFSTVGSVPASTTSFVSFTDTGLAFGTYFYRVITVAGSDSAMSNTTTATVGPVNVTHGSGFANHADLTANGNTTFPSNTIQLTDGMNGEAGTVFTNTAVGIRRFTSSFTIQQSGIADGMAFIIQSNSSTALGNGGGGLGYSGIGNSVAIKFDLFNHGHGGYTTGLYVDGHNPDTPSAGEADISLNGTCLDLHGTTKVDLSYDSSTNKKLIETLTDVNNPSCVITIDDYPPVDIPAHVGSDTAFVGFGAGTGGLASTNVVKFWTLTSDESGFPPRKPSNLQVTNITPTDPTHVTISLAWKGNNAYTATGYRLERSINGGAFAQIGGDLPVSQTSFNDANLAAPGNYAYRVRSFNATSQSTNAPSDAGLCTPVGAGGGLDHSTGFACNGDLDTNGSTRYATISTPQFTGTAARLTDGGGGEAGSIFTVNRLDITHFHTSFVFRIHDPANADGMCFVIQGNDPFQLGFSGGGLGYGSDSRTGPIGIPKSLCVKFDIFDNAGEGVNSTGLFLDGRSPTNPERDSPDVLVNLDGTTINLRSQDRFQVDLMYDGTTLTEKITDLDSGAAPFTTSYTVNIPAHVGGNTGFIGYTGGTGGLTATQDVQKWTFQNP